MEAIVYVDLLFLINFLIDTVIIYTCSKILKRDLKIYRLIFSSLLAALYSVIAFFPKLSFLGSVVFKIVFFILPSIMAFPSRKILEIARNTMVLCVTYAVFGGVMFLLIFATDFGTKTGAVVSNGEVYLNISSTILILSVILAYLLVYVMSYVNYKGINIHKNITKAELCFNNKKITVNSLEDTGCSLIEPLSGKPVFILSHSIAKGLLPKTFWDYINNCDTDISDFHNRYKIIPYSTIENSSGIMHGFICDYIKIKNIFIRSAVIGISPISLNEGHEFDAIFNPEILNNIKETVYHEEKIAT